MAELHISITAEKIYKITENFWVTNSLLTSWVTIIILSLFALMATRRLKKIPGNLQSIAEVIVDGLDGLFRGVLHENTKLYFPVLATFFLYIMSMNWLGLLPGVGTIGIKIMEKGHEAFVPIFRAGTADLNTTIALAIIAILVVQYAGLKSAGFGYLKKFLNFKNPINFFVGILELASEFSRVLSFAFRLFGNIFAGEVLLTVIAFIIPIVAPIPFMGLELFVGFIQALVFSMLSTVFLSLATEKV